MGHGSQGQRGVAERMRPGARRGEAREPGKKRWGAGSVAKGVRPGAKGEARGPREDGEVGDEALETEKGGSRAQPGGQGRGPEGLEPKDGEVGDEAPETENGRSRAQPGGQGSGARGT